jgi:phytoene synthase
MNEAYQHCEALVRNADKDRYLATLFAPADLRPHAFALYAFNVEVASVRERARDPLAGEVRLQWWRDVLAGKAAGDVARNPVAAALIDTIERRELPRQMFWSLIDARQFDLYDEPMETSGQLESYLRRTSSSLFELVGRLRQAHDPSIAETADCAGLSYGITGLLRAFQLHASRGQLYVPVESLDRSGAGRGDVAAGRTTPALLAALSDLRGQARQHLTKARAHLPAVAEPARTTFLPLALVDAYLSCMDRPDYDPFQTAVEIPQWRRQWLLWRATRRFG